MKSVSNRLKTFWLLAGMCVATPVSPLLAAENKTSAVKQSGAVMLLYEEQESGTETYPIRMIVTDDYVRSDDGVDDGSYLLYDRREKILYSVVPDEGRVLVLTHTPFEEEMPY